MGKAVVLGIDGVPYTFLKNLLDDGIMPYTKKLVESGTLSTMNSVYPPVSSCAWTSFSTGKNPGGHNIYGFVDKEEDSNNFFIPTSENMTSKQLWETISDNNKRVVVINVPVTHPVRDVNGILISGFLCTDIEEVTKDKATLSFLKQIGYKIDADADIAKESKLEFLNEIHDTHDKRERALLALMENEKWDFFMCHLMETDRLFHFFLREINNKDEQYYDKCMDLFRKIDKTIEKVHKLIGDIPLMFLSDHGFTEIIGDFQLNRWLEQKGYLKLKENHKEEIMLNKIDFVNTKCYSLIPGRIYITGENKEEIIKELTNDLNNLIDPDTDKKIIQSIHRKEDVFSGVATKNAPDLVLNPTDGYDLKANFGGTKLLEQGLINGMHTFDNAMFFCSKKINTNIENFNIADVHPTILDLMNIKKPDDLTGRSLIK